MLRDIHLRGAGNIVGKYLESSLLSATRLKRITIELDEPEMHGPISHGDFVSQMLFRRLSEYIDNFSEGIDYLRVPACLGRFDTVREVVAMPCQCQIRNEGRRDG